MESLGPEQSTNNSQLSPQSLISKLQKSGFKFPQGLIHVFPGGSTQHGAAIPNKVSDLDICGVYIESPKYVLGLDKEESYTDGTSDQYEKNKPGDEDYKCYSLRRWARLAASGNPTILGYLFTSPRLPGVWKDFIFPNKKVFVASSHACAFLGYAKGQISRLHLGGVGTSGRGKHGQRPELEEQFGYDTKAAMHLMRLLFEAEEYLKTGVITYPRPEKDLLLAIRQGAWNETKLIREYAEAETRVKEAEKVSPLPEKVDRKEVSELITTCYIQHWLDRQLLDDYAV